MSSKSANHLFYLIAGLIALLASLLATIPPEILSLVGAAVPARWKPYIAAIPLIAAWLGMWVKGHKNLDEEPPK